MAPELEAALVRRDIFTAEQEDFRSLVRDFVEREIVPAYPQWEQAGRRPGRSSASSASSA